MAALKVTFKPAAIATDRRPRLPRSGASATPLPAWHPHEVIMVGGYTEELGTAPTNAIMSMPPGPRRAPTLEAWTFTSSDGGRWLPVHIAADSPMPQPRLTSQAIVVGDELWLVAGWDPSAVPDSGTPHFLSDVWALDLRTYRWRQVAVKGEEMQSMSRFAMAASPDGRLLLHTHRCDDHVLVMDPRGHGGRTDLPGSVALSRLPVRGTPSPASRGLHSLTAAAAAPRLPLPQQQVTAVGGIGGGTAMYLYGGAPQSGLMYDDLWILNLESLTWRQLTPEGLKPQARCSHAAVACSGGGDIEGRYLLVIGGSYYVEQGRLQPLDDVIVYDTQTNRWLEVEVEGPRPCPRNAGVMCPLRAPRWGTKDVLGDGSGEHFLFHGGWRPFVETYNDTYIVTVTSADRRK